MGTLKAIFEAIAAVFVYLVKAWPTWSESRQTKIDKLRSQRNDLVERLGKAQRCRDGYVAVLEPCPDWLCDQISELTAAIRRCDDELRALEGRGTGSA